MILFLLFAPLIPLLFIYESALWQSDFLLKTALLKTKIYAAKLFFEQLLSHLSTNINKCYLTEVVEGRCTVTSVVFYSLRLIFNPFYLQ